MFAPEDKERVRQQTDFVALVSETVVLKQRGGEFWGCCPFHKENSPSFKVNPSTGLWHCFGCGEGGDLFSYVQRHEGLDFPDAVRYLADRAGVELTETRSASSGPRRNRLVECLAEASSFYSMMLLRGRGDDAGAARSYLAGRGFGADVCRRWGLGYAPGRGQLVAHLRSKGFSTKEIVTADLALERGGRLQDRFYDRVMFPICDEVGRNIAFGGRVLTDAKPKYLNTKETPVFHKSKHMFAFDRAKDTIVSEGVAIVSEGYTDVIAMHEAGFTNTVAALGTSFSSDHVRTLSRFAKTIVCLFDGDAAGQRAAERAVRYIADTEADLRCVVLPGNMDPAEYLAAKGAEGLRGELGSSRPLIDFVFDKRLEGYDLSVPGQRVRALADMASVLAPLKNTVLLDGYATRLADALDIDVSEARRKIREAPIRHADDAESPRRTAGATPGATGSESRQARTGRESNAVGTPTYHDAYDVPPADVYDEAPPIQSARATHSGSPALSLASGADALSADARRQAEVERDLLCVMAVDPDSVRPFADRVASFAWTDPRYEAIAWSILATPVGTQPHEVVRAAEGVVPEAAGILSGGTYAGSDGASADKVPFLLDQVELFSTRRRVRRIKSRLRGSVSANDSQGLFQEATELQRRIGELEGHLAGYEGA